MQKPETLIDKIPEFCVSHHGYFINKALLKFQFYRQAPSRCTKRISCRQIERSYMPWQDPSSGPRPRIQLVTYVF